MPTNNEVIYAAHVENLKYIQYSIDEIFTLAKLKIKCKQENTDNFKSIIRLLTQLSHLKPSSFPVTSLNRSIMAVKFSFLLTTSSILAISSKIAKNACIAIAKV